MTVEEIYEKLGLEDPEEFAAKQCARINSRYRQTGRTTRTQAATLAALTSTESPITYVGTEYAHRGLVVMARSLGIAYSRIKFLHHGPDLQETLRGCSTVFIDHFDPSLADLD